MNPYGGASTLATTLRVSAAGFGLVFGSVKLSHYKSKSAKNAAAKAAKGEPHKEH